MTTINKTQTHETSPANVLKARLTRSDNRVLGNRSRCGKTSLSFEESMATF
jgi:hypothetical protein